MLYFHNTLEVVMILIIAFLITKHLNLEQDYNTLKTHCSNNSAKCQCYHAERTNPIMQTGTEAVVQIASSALPSSLQASGDYWTYHDASSRSFHHDTGNQSQSFEASYILISSSLPLSSIDENPRETGASEIITKPLEKDARESEFDRMKEVISIPETDGASVINIPSVQSSDTIYLQSTINFNIETNSEPISSSNFYVQSPLHKPTSSVQDSELYHAHAEDKGNDKIDGNYYNMPVAKTSTITDFNDLSSERLTESLSITSTDLLQRQTVKNIDASETSTDSDILKEFRQDTEAHTRPLHASTTLQYSIKNDEVTPLSTEVKDNINDNKDKIMDDNNSFYGDNTEIIQTPPKPYEFLSNEGIIVETETKVVEQKKDIFDEIISNDDKTSLARGSTAKCIGSSTGKRHCVFNNICYNAQKKDFIFFKGPDSFVESDKSQDTANVFTISLSTLSEHNALMLPLVTLPVQSLSNFSVSLIHKKSIAITRFKPDNIMHVLHDDILPLFHTLQHFNFPRTESAFDTLIIFTDAYEGGDYLQLYSSLSNFKPLSLTKFNESQNLACFTDIYIGLSTSTIWYQYGFHKPQGPLPDLNMQAFTYIQEASQYIANFFQTDCFLCKQKDYLVFLSRKDNRLILNEGDLIMALSKSTRLKVFSISLEMHSLAEVITIIRSSRGIIGMHGSLMSVAVFLPRGGIVIELFPFAINPSRYTPFKTFSELPGSFITYKSWVNSDRQKSIPHPDWTQLEGGGIRHLPKQTQKEIESQTEVPEHLCCNDPSWLYHIYQDTYVNISEVVSLSVQALTFQSSKISHMQPPDLPGTVEKLQCRQNSDKNSAESGKEFIVSWLPHWGLQYYPSPQDLRYEVTVQEKGSIDATTSVLTIDIHLLSYTMSSSDHAVYNVWVTVISVDDNSNSGISTSSRSQSKFIICPS